jgi:general secretion pathway protein J
MKRPLSDRCGFTLLELLIAMALLAVVVVIVVSAMRLGFRSLEKGDRMVLSLERVRTSFSIIEAQLQSAFSLAPPRDAQAGEPMVQFRGDAGAVEFLSYHSLWGGTKGPVAVSYRVVDDGNGKKSLVISETPVGMDALREAVLMESADDILFEFYYRGPTDEKGQWVERWEQEDQLPPKVRLSIRKDRRLITLVAPLRLAPKEIRTVGAGSTVKP